MPNERKTENRLEQIFRSKGYTDDELQFQGSADEEIQRCLPSKRSNKEGSGKPEHILRLNGDAADLLVTECKQDRANHASAQNLTEDSHLKPTKYAVDGLLHYMKGLRKEFNVIGLAVSGTDTLEITTYKALRGGSIVCLPDKAVLRREDYLTVLRNSEGYGAKSAAEIAIFAKSLHEYLRDEMELPETQKPLIVSGILLALKNVAFEAGYRATANKDNLAENLVLAIKQTLRSNKVKDEKIEAMMSGYDFIRVNKSVKEHLMPTIAKIYRHLFFALQPNSSLDLLGSFYGEFLRYSGGDMQGLGIVLTPRHITELFADLADLNPERSVVLDICAGTGGFLISAMANMVAKAPNDSGVVERIKNHQLVGIELDQHMFTLACANMIFWGDGKANMFWDDCLKPRDPETIGRITGMKPNVAFLNPPYSKKAKGKNELAFVKRAVDLLEPNGIAIAIVPVGALIDDGSVAVALKKDILESHTLKAVMSMPPQLFPGVGTVTAIIVLDAHKPHYRYEEREKTDANGEPISDEGGGAIMERVAIPKAETWFGYWRDDGFITSKNKRVERSEGAWAAIKAAWLLAYSNRQVRAGESCRHAVSHTDEWVAEAYMETDYSALTPVDFEKDVKKFALYTLMIDIQGPESEDASDEA